MSTKQRKEDTSLVKILLFICVVAAIAAGTFKFAGWFSGAVAGRTAQTEAPNALENARQALEQGDPAAAVSLLAPLAEKTSDPVLAPEVLLTLAQAHQQYGDLDAASAQLDRVMKEYPQSPEYPEAALAFAGLLEEKGQYLDAVVIYKQIQATAPGNLRARALIGLGRQAAREDVMIQARSFYNEALKEAEWNSAPWNEALDALGTVNVALVFSPQATPESKEYVVQRGDSLTSIGNALNVPQGMLTRANQITEAASLSLGQRLKYTPKDFRIVIERSTCRLFLLDKEGIFKRYHTGLGMPGHETTLGSYKIGNKQKDPTWFKPGAAPVPPGDPQNELGTRWMPLVPDAAGLPTDLGIHGTIVPESIGQYSSHGCPRMQNAEVEELYDLVVRATPVDIVEVFDRAEWGL